MSTEQHDADAYGQELGRLSHHQHEATAARFTVFQALAARRDRTRAGRRHRGEAGGRGGGRRPRRNGAVSIRSRMTRVSGCPTSGYRRCEAGLLPGPYARSSSSKRARYCSRNASRGSMYPARSSLPTALSATSRKSDPSGQWRVPGAATAHGSGRAQDVRRLQRRHRVRGGFVRRRLLRGGGGRLLDVGEQHGAGGDAPAPGGGGGVGDAQQVAGDVADPARPLGEGAGDRVPGRPRVRVGAAHPTQPVSSRERAAGPDRVILSGPAVVGSAEVERVLAKSAGAGVGGGAVAYALGIDPAEAVRRMLGM